MIKSKFLVCGEFPTESGEVSITLASGVPEVNIKKGSESCKVSVLPDMAQNPIGGYMFVSTPWFPIIEKAIEEEKPILLRFEKQRKKGVDPKIPIKELIPDMATAKKNVNNTCVGIYDFNSEKWIMDRQQYNGADTPEMTEFIKIVGEGELDEADIENFFKENEKTPTVSNTPNLLKPASFDKQQALLSCYYFLLEKITTRNPEMKIQEKYVRAFSEKLLLLADIIYKEIMNTDVVNYKDYAHTRARFLVFNYEENVEHLTESAVREYSQWLKRNMEYNISLLKWAKESN